MNGISRVIISAGCLSVVIGLLCEQIELSRLARETEGERVLTEGVLSRKYSGGITNKFSFEDAEYDSAE